MEINNLLCFICWKQYARKQKSDCIKILKKCNDGKKVATVNRHLFSKGIILIKKTNIYILKLKQFSLLFQNNDALKKKFCNF